MKFTKQIAVVPKSEVPPPTAAQTPSEAPAPSQQYALSGSFTDCMELSRRAQQTEKSMLFATMAQAYALKEIADKLDALNEFAGVYDAPDTEDAEDGEEGADPRLADTLAEGILGAVSVVKDDITSMPLVQFGMAAAHAEIARVQAAGAKDNG